MNTWFVGNHPVGHFVDVPNNNTSEQNTSSTSLMDATKTFYMKARILAGQAKVSKANETANSGEDADEIEDFKWLSKDEIEKTVDRDYWLKVRNMLVEQ